MRFSPQITQMSADFFKAMKSNNDPQTYAIIGAAMEVHRVLGHGFLEAVYQEALALEFMARQIPFNREVPIRISYKKQILACGYKADFICFGEILVELKAIEKLGDVEKSQVLNYLNGTGYKRALLINFGAPSLEYQRLVLNYQGNESGSHENLRPSA
jgi:GxxExxY protein